MAPQMDEENHNFCIKASSWDSKTEEVSQMSKPLIWFITMFLTSYYITFLPTKENKQTNQPTNKRKKVTQTQINIAHDQENLSSCDPGSFRITE